MKCVQLKSNLECAYAILVLLELNACVRIAGQHNKQFYYRQLKTEQLDEMSAKVSEMQTKCVFTRYVN